MKSIFFSLIIFISAISLFAQSETPSHKFDPNRDPNADLKAAIDMVKSSNKRIILDVGGEWCIWCHRIDAFMDSTKEVKEYIDKHYVIVKINFSKENKNEKFLSAYPEIQGYPHFFVLDKNKFLSFLQKWAVNK